MDRKETNTQTGLAGFEPAHTAVKVLCLNRLAIALETSKDIISIFRGAHKRKNNFIHTVMYMKPTTLIDMGVSINLTEHELNVL